MLTFSIYPKSWEHLWRSWLSQFHHLSLLAMQRIQLPVWNVLAWGPACRAHHSAMLDTWRGTWVKMGRIFNHQGEESSGRRFDDDWEFKEDTMNTIHQGIDYLRTILYRIKRSLFLSSHSILDREVLASSFFELRSDLTCDQLVLCLISRSLVVLVSLSQTFLDIVNSLREW